MTIMANDSLLDLGVVYCHILDLPTALGVKVMTGRVLSLYQFLCNETLPCCLYYDRPLPVPAIGSEAPIFKILMEAL